jgi:hypothetical protein
MVRGPSRLVGVPLLAIALGALVGGPASAQGPNDSPIKVTAGGVAGPIVRARPRAFVAVRVLLENDSAREVEGTLRVYRAASPGDSGAEQGLFFERRVALPRGGRRAETVYYYAQENEPPRQLCVTFLPDDAPAPAPVFPELQVNRDSALVLVISSQDAEEALGVFRSATIPGPRRLWRTETLRAEVSALPDHLAGYDAFDTVAVTDLDPGDLPAESARALVEWVEAGGDLVVAFSGRREVPLELRALLPVVRPGGPDRAVERSLVGLRALGRGRGWPGDERVLCDEVLPAPGAEVLAGTAEAPLILRGRRGAGWVTYLTFPLDAAPLRRWPEKPDFAGNLVRLPRAELGGKTDAPMVAPPLEELQLNLSEALATLTPPSALLIAPLLIFYVVLVSPLNYALLARRRRLKLSQPVAAAVVFVFGLLFYGIGRVYKGSEDMVTQVAVVELPVESGRARVDVMTGYYSTSQALVAATAPPGAAVGPIAEEPTGREGRIVDDPAGARLDGLTVATWSLRRFRTLRAQDLGAVAVDLTLDQTVLRGSVHNRSQLTLDAPVLLLPCGFLELSSALSPGEKLELKGISLVRFESDQRADSIELLGVLKTDASGGYPPVYGRDLGVGSMGTGDPYLGSSLRRIFGTVMHRLRRVPGSSDRLPALLVARAVGDAGGVVVEGTGAPTLARQLVVVEAQVRLPIPGNLAMNGLEPRVSLTPKLADDWVPVDGPTGAPPMLGGGFNEPAVVEFVWTVPSSEQAPLRAGLLRLRWHIPGYLPNVYSYVDAYDFKERGWRQLISQTDADKEDGQPFWSIPGPQVPEGMRADDLIDPTSGTIKFRFRNQGSNMRLGWVALDVHGTR